MIAQDLMQLVHENLWELERAYITGSYLFYQEYYVFLTFAIMWQKELLILKLTCSGTFILKSVRNY